MVFKTVFFAALCVAQVFAYVPAPLAFARNVICPKPTGFEEAVAELDDARNTISLTALDAYSRGGDAKVIIACLRAEKDKFVQLGQQFATDVRAASEELAKEVKEKSEEYAKQMEEPMTKIYVTLKELPEKVQKYLEEGQFLKAAAAIEEAKKVVEENGRILSELSRKFVSEVPDLADKVEKMAEKIRSDARKGAQIIRESFRKCVENGGPTTPSADE